MKQPTCVMMPGDDIHTNKTILTIIQGELRNWGYDVGEITLDYEPNWGDAVLKMEVKTSGA